MSDVGAEVFMRVLAYTKFGLQTCHTNRTVVSQGSPVYKYSDFFTYVTICVSLSSLYIYVCCIAVM